MNPLEHQHAQDVILLAEDREDDIIIIRHAFAKAKFLNPLHIVRDGQEAIDYLQGEGKYANRDEYPLPSLLLLDLKLPRKDGLDVLKWVRSQPGLSALRIVVLSASEQVRDINKAYQLGANSFLLKPLDFTQFVEMTRALKGYWLWMSKEPETSRPPPLAENANRQQSPLSPLPEEQSAISAPSVFSSAPPRVPPATGQA